MAITGDNWAEALSGSEEWWEKATRIAEDTARRLGKCLGAKDGPVLERFANRETLAILAGCDVSRVTLAFEYRRESVGFRIRYALDVANLYCVEVGRK